MNSLTSLFELDETKLQEQIPVIFDRASIQIKQAEPLFNIEGESLEKISRDLAKHQAHYAVEAQNMKHILKWLENHQSKLEARHARNYGKGQRVLSATDQRLYTQGEPDIVEIKQLGCEASRLYSVLAEIVDAFKQMGWMAGNITKLRVAELQDIIL